MKNFTSLSDIVTASQTVSADIDTLIDRAIAYKQNPFTDRQLGTDKRIGLVFLNPSLRTRMSTQIAAEQLGMQALVFNIGSEGWSWEFEDGAVMNGSTAEHIKDAVPVLSAYFDVLAIRTFPTLTDRERDYSEAVLNSFIQYATVPVMSLESATLHPLQSLADVMTIKEHFPDKPKAKVVLCWAPHIKALPQCVANSFVQWINAWDATELTIAHPPGYELEAGFAGDATIVHNKYEALRDADFIYVKNWSAYSDYGTMPPVDDDWMLHPSDLEHSNQAKIMHCLPVRRNVELSDALLDGKQSIVTAQAGNRVWAAQAVLSQLLQSNYGTC